MKKPKLPVKVKVWCALDSNALLIPSHEYDGQTLGIPGLYPTKTRASNVGTPVKVTLTITEATNG